MWHTLCGNFIQLLKEEGCPIDILLCKICETLKRASCIQQRLQCDRASEAQGLQCIQHLKM